MIQQEAKRRSRSKRDSFITPAQLLMEHHALERQKKRIEYLKKHKATKKQHTLVEEPNNKVVLVIRTGNEHITKHGLHPLMKKALNSLRLRHHNSAVFLRLDNPKTCDALKFVSPMVVYGEPSLNTVRDLLLKRGTTLIDGKPQPITDNVLIEEKLGEHDIICLEDLIHELVQGGEAFDAVARFLLPFRLQEPTKLRLMRKLNEFKEREENDGHVVKKDVDSLVKLMN